MRGFCGTLLCFLEILVLIFQLVLGKCLEMIHIDIVRLDKKSS